MPSRPEWFHRGHPPACSCVNCVERRRRREIPIIVRRGESAREAQQAIKQGLGYYRRRNLVRRILSVLVLIALGALIPVVLALLLPDLAEQLIADGQDIIARGFGGP